MTRSSEEPFYLEELLRALAFEQPCPPRNSSATMFRNLLNLSLQSMCKCKFKVNSSYLYSHTLRGACAEKNHESKAGKIRRRESKLTSGLERIQVRVLASSWHIAVVRPLAHSDGQERPRDWMVKDGNGTSKLIDLTASIVKHVRE